MAIESKLENTTMAPEPLTTTKKKKKTAKKKRRISKHIVQANKDREALEKARKTDANPAAAVEEDDDDNEEPTKENNNNNQQHVNVKDVKQAAGYLSNWKNHRDQWKFNKNTQSWLIRHMYESEKVAKGTFALLLDYLQGLQGQCAKQRLLDDATRRALRYKQYQGEEDVQDEDNDSKSNSTKVKFAEDTKAAAEQPTKSKMKKKLSANATEDEKRWNSLSDHDKRKEYKRARKILETIKSTE